MSAFRSVIALELLEITGCKVFPNPGYLNYLARRYLLVPYEDASEMAAFLCGQFGKLSPQLADHRFQAVAGGAGEDEKKAVVGVSHTAVDVSESSASGGFPAADITSRVSPGFCMLAFLSFSSTTPMGCPNLYTPLQFPRPSMASTRILARKAGVTVETRSAGEPLEKPDILKRSGAYGSDGPQVFPVDTGVVGETPGAYHPEEDALELHWNGHLGVVARYSRLEDLFADDRRVVLDIVKCHETTRLAGEPQKPLAQRDGEWGFQYLTQAVDLVETQTPARPVRQKDGDLLGASQGVAGPADVVGSLTGRSGAELSFLDH